MDVIDLIRRFDYHPPRDTATAEAHTIIRQDCRALAEQINGICPEGREKALAITHLEEVMMWANAAIARAGD